MELYRVDLKVRPDKRHPMFWDVEFGYLCLWLFGESPEDAGERAALIVEQLPYERTDDRVTIHEDTLGARNQFEKQYSTARSVGLALLLVGCATGADHQAFDASPPL